ncbi:MAG: hypothetical protein MMC23_009025 [Stictis urceolatum]|nr:hypothetical protein [Stictis urceolata]
MLYEYWTVPDLANYTDEDRVELKDIIRRMHDTLTGWSRSHLLAGLSFPVQSGIFRPSCIPSLAASVISLIGSTGQNNSPVAIPRPSSEQVQELRESIDIQTESPSIASIGNATSNAMALSKRTSVPASATSDHVNGMPTLQEGREGRTAVESLVTRSLFQGKSIAPSLSISPSNSIAAPSDMHEGNRSSAHHEMISPTDLFPQQNQATF